MADGMNSPARYYFFIPHDQPIWFEESIHRKILLDIDHQFIIIADAVGKSLVEKADACDSLGLFPPHILVKFISVGAEGKLVHIDV